jgi:uncharacterized membrane protein
MCVGSLTGGESMRVSDVVRFLAVFSTGLVAGIYLGDRMGASFARPELSPSSFVKFQQIQHVHFLKMMPVLLGIAILSSMALLARIRSRVGSPEFVFVALGTLACISVIVVTRTVNVPINNQLMTWDASSPPAGVMEIWARWERMHSVRTFLAILGFGFELVALRTPENFPAP